MDGPVVQVLSSDLARIVGYRRQPDEHDKAAEALEAVSSALSGAKAGVFTPVEGVLIGFLTLAMAGSLVSAAVSVFRAFASGSSVYPVLMDLAVSLPFVMLGLALVALVMVGPVEARMRDADRIEWAFREALGRKPGAADMGDLIRTGMMRLDVREVESGLSSSVQRLRRLAGATTRRSLDDTDAAYMISEVLVPALLQARRLQRREVYADSSVCSEECASAVDAIAGKFEAGEDVDAADLDAAWRDCPERMREACGRMRSATDRCAAMCNSRQGAGGASTTARVIGYAPGPGGGWVASSAARPSDCFKSCEKDPDCDAAIFFSQDGSSSSQCRHHTDRNQASGLLPTPGALGDVLIKDGSKVVAPGADPRSAAESVAEIVESTSLVMDMTGREGEVLLEIQRQDPTAHSADYEWYSACVAAVCSIITAKRGSSGSVPDARAFSEALKRMSAAELRSDVAWTIIKASAFADVRRASVAGLRTVRYEIYRALLWLLLGCGATILLLRVGKGLGDHLSRDMTLEGRPRIDSLVSDRASAIAEFYMDSFQVRMTKLIDGTTMIASPISSIAKQQEGHPERIARYRAKEKDDRKTRNAQDKIRLDAEIRQAKGDAARFAVTVRFYYQRSFGKIQQVFSKLVNMLARRKLSMEQAIAKVDDDGDMLKRRKRLEARVTAIFDTEKEADATGKTPESYDVIRAAKAAKHLLDRVEGVELPDTGFDSDAGGKYLQWRFLNMQQMLDRAERALSRQTVVVTPGRGSTVVDAAQLARLNAQAERRQVAMLRRSPDWNVDVMFLEGSAGTLRLPIYSGARARFVEDLPAVVLEAATGVPPKAAEYSTGAVISVKKAIVFVVEASFTAVTSYADFRRLGALKGRVVWVPMEDLPRRKFDKATAPAVRALVEFERELTVLATGGEDGTFPFVRGAEPAKVASSATRLLGGLRENAVVVATASTSLILGFTRARMMIRDMEANLESRRRNTDALARSLCKLQATVVGPASPLSDCWEGWEGKPDVLRTRLDCYTDNPGGLGDLTQELRSATAHDWLTVRQRNQLLSGIVDVIGKYDVCNGPAEPSGARFPLNDVILWGAVAAGSLATAAKVFPGSRLLKAVDRASRLQSDITSSRMGDVGALRRLEWEVGDSDAWALNVIQAATEAAKWAFVSLCVVACIGLFSDESGYRATGRQCPLAA